MENVHQPGACIVCNKQNALLCERCRSTSYCSQECQRTDFPIHKLLCAGFANFDVTTRPTPGHHRAILFPGHQTHPKLIWLGPDLTTAPKLSPVPRFTKIIQTNLILARQLSDTVCIYYSNSVMLDESTPNKSIVRITATGPGKYWDWRGPIIAYGKVGLSLDPGRLRDLDMNDFRHVTDYFLCCGFYIPLPTMPSSLPKVRAVRLNCRGDQNVMNRPPIEQIELSTNHPIFTINDTSAVAARVGIPLFTQRCPPHRRWKKDKRAYYNEGAMNLHMHIHPEVTSPTHVIPRQYLAWVGSVIVVRQDKKPLSLSHVEALCTFCMHLFPRFLGVWTGTPVPMEIVQSKIDRPTFADFFPDFIHIKHNKNEPVDDISSPYDV